MELRGRVALVTGGAQRVGRAIVRALAEAGADVAIHYHTSAEQAREAVDEMRALGVQAEAIQADLAQPSEIERLFAQLEAGFGRLDVAVNNAANFERKPVLEITPQDWERVINLNLRGPFFCSQAAARLMKRQGTGTIINIADLAAFQAWPSYTHHCIAKAGVVTMTRALARALAPAIRVNAVAPGPVLPPDGLGARERRELAEQTALGRLGTPGDVAGAVVFLATSDYITGETIVVDGGRLLRS